MSNANEKLLNEILDAVMEAIEPAQVSRSWIEGYIRPVLEAGSTVEDLFVFCAGGCVSAVTDERGEDLQEQGNIHVVDFDLAEGGECPVCREEADWDDEVCPSCGFHWDGEDYNEAIKCVLALKGGE